MKATQSEEEMGTYHQIIVKVDQNRRRNILTKHTLTIKIETATLY